MIINHNMNAMNAHRNMSANTVNAGKSMEKLSSGLRINKAGDDAAGLAISEKMRGQIRGLDQASRNSQDAISMIQTAEGALNETHSILQRVRELAVQSSNDTTTAEDRGKIQSEVDELAKEITRISNNTEFNTQKLLDGGIQDNKLGKLTFHIGANQDQAITLDIKAMDSYSLGVAGSKASADVTNAGTGNIIASANVSRTFGTGVADGTSLVLTGTNVAASTGSIAQVSLNSGATTIDLATTTQTDALNGYTIKFTHDASAGTTVTTNVDTNNKVITVSGKYTTAAGATETTMEDSINSALSAKGFTAQVNLTIAGTTPDVADIQTASASGYAIGGGADGTMIDIKDGGGTTLATVKKTDTTIKINSGSYEGVTLNLSSGKKAGDFNGLAGAGRGQLTFDVTGANASTFNSGSLTAKASTEAGVNVSSQTDANKAITTIDNAIKSVSEERSKLGAYQNRLEHTIANLGTSSENLTAAESRIRDVDMAKEMMTFSKNNILSQAAQAMLAQANSQPQGVLQLLR